VWHLDQQSSTEDLDEGAMFGTDEDKKEPAEREVEDVDAVAEDFKTSDTLDGKGVKVVEQKDDDGEDCVWVVAIKCIPQQDRRIQLKAPSSGAYRCVEDIVESSDRERNMTYVAW
jgi:hypothetical protein